MYEPRVHASEWLLRQDPGLDDARMESKTPRAKVDRLAARPMVHTRLPDPTPKL